MRTAFYRLYRRLLRGWRQPEPPRRDAGQRRAWEMASAGIDEEPLDLRTKILVLGDSHVRSYAGNPNFFPVFLGQGRLHNFVSDSCAETYHRKAERVISQVTARVVLLIMGEPDCRWAYGRGWIPWDPKEVAAAETAGGLPNSPETSIEASLQRMLRTVEHFMGRYPDRLFLVPPVFPVEMEELRPISRQLNAGLQKCLGEAYLYVPEAFNGESSCLVDKVHQSNAIQAWIERELRQRGIPLQEHDVRETAWRAEDVKEKFVRNERFGCFVFED